MSTAPTLFVASLFSLVAAGVYLYVGTRVGQRRVEGEARLASDLFGVWWFALAGVSAVGGVATLAGGLGLTSLPFHLAVTHLNLLGLCIALWGLLYYLVYLYTGRRGVLFPLSVFYVAFYLTLVYVIAAARPVSVVVGDWNVDYVYADDFGAPLTLALVGLLVGPPILAALAYFLLFFRVTQRTQRYRIALVSGSILVWFGSALAGNIAGVGDALAWNLFTRLLGLAAALTILLAYLPPAAWRRRYGLVGIDEEAIR